MGKRQPASTKTAVRPCRVAACQRVNMTTCERALQSGEALEAQLQEGTPEADVLSLSSCCPLLVRFSGSLRDKSWPQCQAALASPVQMSSSSPLVAIFLVLSIIVLSFSCPLFLFISSCSSLGMLPSCCSFGVVRSQLVLLLSSWCVCVVFLPSSFCPPYVLLLSRCLRCLGWGCGRPRQQ